MSKLIINHNAGFFSCCSEALVQIIADVNEYGYLREVDRSEQYALYKNGNEDLTTLFFKEMNIEEVIEPTRFTDADGYYQFTDYRDVKFYNIYPYLNKFFSPSNPVISVVREFIDKYAIDLENTAAVVYRGNDKVTECPVAPYQDFIDKASEYKGMRFFVLPDEAEFMQAFQQVHDNSFTPDELPVINKDIETANFYQVPIEDRADYAARFLAAIIIASRCKVLITHTGNVGMWSILYRGSTHNAHQWFNDKFIY